MGDTDRVRGASAGPLLVLVHTTDKNKEYHVERAVLTPLGRKIKLRMIPKYKGRQLKRYEIMGPNGK
jgi:hypothetical protein